MWSRILCPHYHRCCFVCKKGRALKITKQCYLRGTCPKHETKWFLWSTRYEIRAACSVDCVCSSHQIYINVTVLQLSEKVALISPFVAFGTSNGSWSPRWFLATLTRCSGPVAPWRPLKLPEDARRCSSLMRWLDDCVAVPRQGWTDAALTRITPFDTQPPVPCSVPDGPTGVCAQIARTVKAKRQEAASRFTSLLCLL